LHTVKQVPCTYFLKTGVWGRGSYMWVNIVHRNNVLEYRAMLPLYFAQCWTGTWLLPVHPPCTHKVSGFVR